MTGRSKVLSLVKGIKWTSDTKEVARMLNSEDWIALCAAETEPIVFFLGRITDQ